MLPPNPDNRRETHGKKERKGKAFRDIPLPMHPSEHDHIVTASDGDEADNCENNKGPIHDDTKKQVEEKKNLTATEKRRNNRQQRRLPIGFKKAKVKTEKCAGTSSSHAQLPARTETAARLMARGQAAANRNKSKSTGKIRKPRQKPNEESRGTKKRTGSQHSSPPNRNAQGVANNRYNNPREDNESSAPRLSDASGTNLAVSDGSIQDGISAAIGNRQADENHLNRPKKIRKSYQITKNDQP